MVANTVGFSRSTQVVSSIQLNLGSLDWAQIEMAKIETPLV